MESLPSPGHPILCRCTLVWGRQSPLLSEPSFSSDRRHTKCSGCAYPSLPLAPLLHIPLGNYGAPFNGFLGQLG
jgi:hypothetical protein